MRGAGFSLIGDLVIGVIGALPSGFIFGRAQLGFSHGGGLVGLSTATIWAVILPFLIPLIKRASSPRSRSRS